MKYDLTKQSERWRALLDGYELINVNRHGAIVKLVDGIATDQNEGTWNLTRDEWILHTSKPEEEKLYMWIIWKPKDKDHNPFLTTFLTEKEIKNTWPEPRGFAHIRDREFPGKFE